MAATLTQMPRDMPRRRAPTLPPRMQPHNPSGIVPMPTPEQYQGGFSGAPSRISGLNHTSTWPSYLPLSYNSSRYYQLPPPRRSPRYDQSPTEYRQQQPPPVPPKIPIETNIQLPSSPQESEFSYSSSSDSTSPSSQTSIEPDPLPPHSNPQALTPTQSEAFASSEPIPNIRLSQDVVWNCRTGIADFTIAREAGRMSSFTSTEPLLTVTRTSTGNSVGHIKLDTLSSNQIELIINDHETAMLRSGVMHNRFGFQSPTSFNSTRTFYWKKDRSTGGAMLKEAKKNGQVVARMKEDLLTFDKPRLSQEQYDEIVVSALAMAEATRRQRRRSAIEDLGSAIGDFTSSCCGSGADRGDSRRRTW